MAFPFLKRFFEAPAGRLPTVARRSSSVSNPSDELLAAFLGDLSSMSGVTVTPLKALGVATVYSCINVTATAISSLPLTLIKRTGDNKEEATGHPLYDLLTCGVSDFVTAGDFFFAQEANRSLRGNCFAQIIRNGRQEVTEIITLENRYVSWRMTQAGPEYFYKNNPIHFTNLLHVKGFTFNGLMGQSVVSDVRDVIGLAIALQDNASKFFANGSKVADVLSTDKRMTPDQIADLKKAFKDRKEKGEDYSALILDNGLKYVAHRSENRDSQFMEARKIQRQEIAASFGIPPSKVGILDNATFSNIEQLGIDFVVNYLQPICRRWEQAINQRLLTRPERKSGLFFKFKLQGLMRGDAAARSAYYHNMIQDGVMTRNEVRILEDLNPLPDLDEPFVPLNMGQAGDPRPDGFQAIPDAAANGDRNGPIFITHSQNNGHAKNHGHGRTARHNIEI